MCKANEYHEAILAEMAGDAMPEDPEARRLRRQAKKDLAETRRRIAKRKGGGVIELPAELP